MPAIETVLRRHRAISVGALVLLMALAWGWLLRGAGMDMQPLVSLAPPAASPDQATGMQMDMPRPAPWSTGLFALTASMWWIMMVAMMLPSAAPTVLLYGRVAASGATTRPSTAGFLAGYLAVWGLFALLATLLQTLLTRSGLLDPVPMASASGRLSGGILIAAGIYQLSPLKNVCLRHCRNPAQFLSRHYRPGSLGALRMGLLHGAYCLGCCWMLMALLFVGGVMNLAWIAILTLMVAAEKLLPFGRWVAIATGVACLTWGAALLLG